MVIEMDDKELIGAKVRYTNKEEHERLPYCYPPVGTIGTIYETNCIPFDCTPGTVLVQWEDGSTSENDLWFCNASDISFVEDGDKPEHSWIEKLGYGGWGDIYWECGSCHKEYSFKEGTPLQNDWHFCPKCGTMKTNEIRIGEDLEDESK